MHVTRFLRVSLYMRPIPHQLGQVFNALFFQCREKFGLAASRLQFGNGQGFGTFGACQFVGLGK